MPSNQKYRSKFLKYCQENESGMKLLASYYNHEISRLLRQNGVLVHDVDARVKSAISLAQKLRRRKYTRPHRQMNDVIGARVITYFRDDVDKVKLAIVPQFEINENKSVFVREHRALNPKDVGFGYNSVHISARMKPEDNARSPLQYLHNPWIEIQIRSILEHSWSEIEHELVYKPNVPLASEIRRKFGAIAAALELIDSEFITLREEIAKRLDEWKSGFRTQPAIRRRKFDVLGMIAAYSVLLPGSIYGTAQSVGIITPEDISCYYALRYVRVSNFSQLRGVLNRAAVKRRINAAAAKRGLPTDRVSYHLLTAMIGDFLRSKGFSRQFPELKISSQFPDA